MIIKSKEDFKRFIDSNEVQEISFAKGDGLGPRELLIFCGEEAYRKAVEVRNAEKAASGPCQHDWNEDLICKKCGKELGPK